MNYQQETECCEISAFARENEGLWLKENKYTVENGLAKECDSLKSTVLLVLLFSSHAAGPSFSTSPLLFIPVV